MNLNDRSIISSIQRVELIFNQYEFLIARKGNDSSSCLEVGKWNNNTDLVLLCGKPRLTAVSMYDYAVLLYHYAAAKSKILEV